MEKTLRKTAKERKRDKDVDRQTTIKTDRKNNRKAVVQTTDLKTEGQKTMIIKNPKTLLLGLNIETPIQAPN